MGTKISRYEVIERIGSGSMGVVYKAVDPLLNRTVAIKTIRIDLEEQDSSEYQWLKNRFFQEARIAGTLSHPNLVTLFDMGEFEGNYYMAMEFVEGVQLSKLISARKTSLPLSIHLARQICRALQFAHQNGVVHRDIKPANIMIQKGATLKVMDFGIAQLQSAHTTSTGTVLGTPAYMAPEQITGKKIDFRTDIFSLGVVLYEMLTGVKPFSGNNLTAIAYKILNEAPTPPTAYNPDIPEFLEKVVLKALAKNPYHRFASCKEFDEALGQALSPRNAAAAPAVQPPREPVPATPPVAGRPLFAPDNWEPPAVNDRADTYYAQQSVLATPRAEILPPQLDLRPEPSPALDLKPVESPAPTIPPPGNGEGDTDAEAKRAYPRKKIDYTKFKKKVRNAEVPPHEVPSAYGFTPLLTRHVYYYPLFLLVILFVFMAIGAFTPNRKLNGWLTTMNINRLRVAVVPFSDQVSPGDLGYGVSALLNHLWENSPYIQAVSTENLMAILSGNQKYEKGVNIFNLPSFLDESGADYVVMGSLTKRQGNILVSFRIFDRKKRLLDEPQQVSVSPHDIAQIPMHIAMALSSRLNMPLTTAQLDFLQKLQSCRGEDLQKFSQGIRYYYHQDYYQSLALLRNTPGYSGLEEAKARFLKTGLQGDKNAQLTPIDYGGINLGLGRIDEAGIYLRQGLAKAPNDIRGLVYQGVYYLEKREYTSAVDALKNALRQDSGNVLANIKLGEAYDALGDRGQAKIYYEAALWNDPFNRAAAEKLVALSRLGVDSFNLPRLSELNSFSPAQKINFAGGDTSLCYQTAAYINNRNFAFERGEQLFQSAQAAKPTDTQLYINWANTKMDSGEQEQAAQIIEQAKQITPAEKSDAIFAWLADFSLKSGDNKNASDNYQKAVAVNPHNSDALTGLGKVAVAEGRPEEGQVFYQKALAVAPANSEAKEGLADTFLALGDLQKAADLLSAIAKDKPRNEKIALKEAEAKLAAGKTQEAAAAYQRAAEVNPVNNDTLDKFKEVCQGYHIKNEAALALDKLLKDRQDFEGYRKSEQEIAKQLEALVATFPRSANTSAGPIAVKTVTPIEIGRDFGRNYLADFWNKLGYRGYDFSNIRREIYSAWAASYTVLNFGGVSEILHRPPFDKISPADLSSSQNDQILNDLAQACSSDALVFYRIKREGSGDNGPRFKIQTIVYLADSQEKFTNAVETSLSSDFIYRRNVYFYFLIFGLVGIVLARAMQRKIHGTGDVHVIINRPELNNKGSFLIKISKRPNLNITSQHKLFVSKNREQLQKARKFRLKTKMDQRFEQQQISRETMFRDLPCGHYYIYLAGMITTLKEDQIIGNYQLNKPIRIERDFVNLVNFDLIPTNSYVQVKVADNDQKVEGAKVSILEKDESKFINKDGEANFFLPRGEYTMQIQYRKRRATHRFKVEDTAFSYFAYVDLDKSTLHIATDMMI